MVNEHAHAGQILRSSNFACTKLFLLNRSSYLFNVVIEYFSVAIDKKAEQEKKKNKQEFKATASVVKANPF